MGYSNPHKVEDYQKAIIESLHNPVLGYTDLGYAKGVLAMISSGANVSFNAVIEPIMKAIQKKCDEKVEMRFGHFYSEEMNDHVQITIIATGIPVDMDDFVTKPEELPKRPQAHAKATHQEPHHQPHQSETKESNSQAYEPMSQTLEPVTQTTKNIQFSQTPPQYSDNTNQFPNHDGQQEDLRLESFDPKNPRKTQPANTYRKPPTRPQGNFSTQSNSNKRRVKMNTQDIETAADSNSRRYRDHGKTTHSASFIRTRSERD